MRVLLNITQRSRVVATFFGILTTVILLPVSLGLYFDEQLFFYLTNGSIGLILMGQLLIFFIIGMKTMHILRSSSIGVQLKSNLLHRVEPKKTKQIFILYLNRQG